MIVKPSASLPAYGIRLGSVSYVHRYMLLLWFYFKFNHYFLFIYGYQLFNVVLSHLLPLPFNIGVSNIKISIRGITFQNILIGLLSLPFIRKRKRDPPVLTFDGWNISWLSDNYFDNSRFGALPTKSHNLYKYSNNTCSFLLYKKIRNILMKLFGVLK